MDKETLEKLNRIEEAIVKLEKMIEEIKQKEMAEYGQKVLDGHITQLEHEKALDNLEKKMKKSRPSGPVYNFYINCAEKSIQEAYNEWRKNNEE